MSTNNKEFDFSGLIILEMANNHQGDVSHGKNIIQAFAPIVERSGRQGALKFQFRDLDTFIHPDFRDSKGHKHISRFLSTRLSNEDFKELIAEARENGLLTMATPFDEASVDTIDSLGVDLIKVASCSATDWPLLEKIAEAGKPVVCSTGGLSIQQVDNLVSFFEHRGVHFALMHCVSVYPTPNHQLGLERIKVFKERYPKVSIGFSTHEHPDNTNAIQVAYAKGARLFERHIGLPTKNITLNSYSSTPEQFEKWLSAHLDVIAMIGSERDALLGGEDEEVDQLVSQMRGVYAKKKIKKGDRVRREDVFFAMPLQENQVASGDWQPDFIADRVYEKNAPLSSDLLPLKLTKKQIVYKAIHEAKGMLQVAKIALNDDSSVTILHPEGAMKFFSVGMISVECITAGYSKKIIVLLPNQSYPAHYHKKKKKTLQVLSGMLTIEINGKSKLLHPGDIVSIPQGAWHAFQPSEGVIVEELSSENSGDHIEYVDKKINKQKEADKETKLLHWGRHQFDSNGSPTYYD